VLRCWRRSSVFPQAKLGSHHREGQQAPTRRRGRFNSPPHQLSRKLLSILDRLGCFSFLSALASIWRMRSRVTENCWPTSSSVWSLFMPMPKRMRKMRSFQAAEICSREVEAAGIWALAINLTALNLVAIRCYLAPLCNCRISASSASDSLRCRAAGSISSMVNA
jgi:hypothetical protein